MEAPSTRHRIITRIEDMTNEEGTALFRGKPVCDTEDDEFASSYLELLEFLEEVYEGGTWPWERVVLTKTRARNLLDRNPRLKLPG